MVETLKELAVNLAKAMPKDGHRRGPPLAHQKTTEQREANERVRWRTLRARLTRGLHVNRETPGCACARAAAAGRAGIR